MFLLALTTYGIAAYLIWFKKENPKKVLLGILSIIFLLLVVAPNYTKQYTILTIIIYLASIFLKLGFKFVLKIIKSIDHRRQFIRCFIYIFLYSLSLFLIISTTSLEWLSWFYFLILFIIDYYYFQFLPWSKKNTQVEKISKNDEWEEAITFAIIAATLIHVFFIQPFTIPTSSMEKNMLVGDFLLVSKLNYGANIPNTPLFLPFMHQKIPGTKNTPSYSKLIQLGYNRLPGFQNVKNNDIVVFNFPADTLRDNIPFDKKMNYVKRCVGISGDSLQIINKEIYINGIKIKNDQDKQFQYIIKPKDSTYISQSIMRDLEKLLVENDIETYAQYTGLNSLIKPSKRRKTEKQINNKLKNTGLFFVFLTNEEKIAIEQKIKKWFSFTQEERLYGNLFPKELHKNWTLDNYGPIYIPKKGDVLNINDNTIYFYKKIIEDYEQNRLAIINNNGQNTYLINGVETTQYLVKMNYYWMMGDNRHNSEDSRKWGFVPENHIVGKPIFTWLSLNYNAIHKEGLKSKLGIIRWDKLFTTIHGNKTTKSYFIHFIIFLIVINLITRYRNHKKIN